MKNVLIGKVGGGDRHSRLNDFNSNLEFNPYSKKIIPFQSFFTPLIATSLAINLFSVQASAFTEIETRSNPRIIGSPGRNGAAGRNGYSGANMAALASVIRSNSSTFFHFGSGTGKTIFSTHLNYGTFISGNTTNFSGNLEQNINHSSNAQGIV